MVITSSLSRLFGLSFTSFGFRSVSLKTLCGEWFWLLLDGYLDYITWLVYWILNSWLCSFFFVEGMCYLEYHLCHTLNMILINIYIYRSHSLSRSLSISLTRINNFKTTILQIYACVRLCITLQKLLDSCHSRLHNQSSINVTQLYVLHRKKATLFNLVNVFHNVSS